MPNNGAVFLATGKGVYMFHGSLVLELTPKGPKEVDPEMIAPKITENIAQLNKATELYQNTGDMKGFEGVRAEAAKLMTLKAEALRKKVKTLDGKQLE